MNRLSKERQAQILSQLVEGCSINSIERMSGASKHTILNLLVDSGEKAQEILDSKLKNVKTRFLQVDEIWTYCGKKQKQCSDAEKSVGLVGDQYIFVAIDADTKLVPLFLLGKRTSEFADQFMRELSERIHGDSLRRFQLTTDAFNAYFQAVYKNFNGVDYAQIHKNYGPEIRGEHRYSPPRLVGITIKPIMGEPIESKISTSYIERQNLTMRMQMRRFTRLTNAFSKKLANLEAALRLHFLHYNFMRVHSTIRCTPAMAAGIEKRIWTWEMILQR